MTVPSIQGTPTTFASLANSTTRLISKPTGTTTGEWLVCIVSMDGSGTLSIDGSFTEAFQLNGSTNSLAVFVRKVDGTEGGSFTITSASESGAGVMFRVQDGDTTNIVDVISVFHGFPPVNGELEAPILYAESDDTLIIHACGADNGTTTLTKPSGDTAVVTNIANASTASAQLTVSRIDQTSAGYAAHAHFTTSLAGEEAISLTIALRSTSTPATYPAQPVIRSVAQHAPLTTQNMNIKKPYGTVDDDLLIAAAVSDVTGTLTPDGSFTSIRDTSNTAVWSQMYRRVAASEPASYTWSNTTAAAKSAVMLRVVNVDTTTPVDTSSQNTGTSTSIDASTITPSVDNCLLLFLGGADDDDVTYNSGFPTGYTNLLTLGSTQGNDSTIMFAFNTQTTKGATGTITGTLTASEEWIAFLAAVAPVVASAGTFVPIVMMF